MQSHSDFATLFNALIVSTAAAVGMVGMLGNAEAARFGRSSFSKSTFSVPKSPPAAPKQAAPANSPAPTKAPSQTAVISPSRKTESNPDHGNATRANLNNAGTQKLSPETSPQMRAHNNSTWGFWDYYWIHTALANRHKNYYTPTSTSQTDRVDSCIKNRLLDHGATHSQIASNAYRIDDLRRRFESARLSGKDIPLSTLSGFDQKMLRAYKDCTYDW